METTQDHIIDRRRMRRKLTVWRIVAFVAVGFAFVALIGAATIASGTNLKKTSPHIARVPVTGFISNSRHAMKQLEKIRKDKNVHAVIISVDSPGGTTVGGEALHNAFRKISATKPVVASIGTLAASAGYMVSIAADHVVAPRTSIVGSVGVIMQYPDATDLLGKIGVSVEEIKSSPLKAEPSPFNQTPPEALAMLETMLLDTYTWFANLVKERRGFSGDDAKGLLDGSVFTGKQALDHKLIDAIGDETVAKAWLVDEKKIDKSLEIVTWSLEKPRQDYILSRAVMGRILSAMGLSQWVSVSEELFAVQQRTRLDGFLSLWQVENIVTN